KKETLEGGVTIQQQFKGIFYHYVIAFYRRMDHLVVVNPSFIPKLIAYQIPANKITYIPNFVSRKEFYPF
ncbi:glycosyltransferase, partial [Lactiplantibacillus pentosus]